MEELLKSQKKQLNAARFSAVCHFLLVVIVAAATAILVPRAFATMQKTNDTMTRLNATVTKADNTIDEIEKIVVQAQQSLEEIDEMVADVKTLVEENDEKVSQSIQSFSEIDIETLNKSIQDLNNVVSPLAGLFKR